MILITGIRTDGAIALIAVSLDLQILDTTVTGIDAHLTGMMRGYTVTAATMTHMA